MWTDLGTDGGEIFLVSKEVLKKSDRFKVYNESLYMSDFSADNGICCSAEKSQVWKKHE